MKLAVACVFALSPAAKAQQADDVWKDLVTDAQRAAAAKDYARAEQIFLKAVHQGERFAVDDVRVGTTLNELGGVYKAGKKYAEAESAYRRAIEILGKANGDDSVEVADVNLNMASLLSDEGHESDAVLYARKSLATYEAQFGGTNLQTGDALCLIGDSLRRMKNFIDAEAPLRRCADIREQDGGVANVSLAVALHSLAQTYAGERKYSEAESRFKLAEKIRENKLGLTSPLLAQTMEDHAAMLRTMGRDKEAARLTLLAAAIRRNETRHNDKKNK